MRAWVNRVVYVLVLAVCFVAGTQLPTTSAGAGSSVRILTIGDSITWPGQWQAELCRLVTAYAGLGCDVRNEAVGQTGCGYWPSRIGGLLATHQPDMVILACGTNDNTTSAAGLDALGTAWRQTVEAIYTFRSPPIPIVPVLIQYSDPLLAPPWVHNSQGPTNDELYRNIQLYAWAGWFPGIVDWQVIPSGADYLDDGGLHPTARGYRYAGWLAYERIAPGMGWPAAPEPRPCGLAGHRPGGQRPVYTLCAEGS